MYRDKISLYNTSKYPDPTARDALQATLDEQNAEEERLRNVIKVVRLILDLAGFELVARIQIKDKKNGKVYR